MSCNYCIGCPYAAEDQKARVIAVFGGVATVDMTNKTFAWSDRRLRLSKKHVAVMAVLAHQADTVVSTDRIALAAWQDSESEDVGDLVRVAVCRISRILREAKAPVKISNIWGVGYRLEQVAA